MNRKEFRRGINVAREDLTTDFLIHGQTHGVCSYLEWHVSLSSRILFNRLSRPENS